MHLFQYQNYLAGRSVGLPVLKERASDASPIPSMVHMQEPGTNRFADRRRRRPKNFQLLLSQLYWQRFFIGASLRVAPGRFKYYCLLQYQICLLRRLGSRFAARIKAWKLPDLGDESDQLRFSLSSFPVALDLHHNRPSCFLQMQATRCIKL
jgi:hypothetical protein